MKLNDLKKVLKEVVREVIQDELKEILLEAIKSPKQPPIQHQTLHTQHIQENTNTPNARPINDDGSIRKSYMEILNETANPSNAGTHIANPGGAKTGNLGEGEMSEDAIMKLLTNG